jgi:hypothetical protein
MFVPLQHVQRRRRHSCRRGDPHRRRRHQVSHKATSVGTFCSRIASRDLVRRIGEANSRSFFSAVDTKQPTAYASSFSLPKKHTEGDFSPLIPDRACAQERLVSKSRHAVFLTTKNSRVVVVFFLFSTYFRSWKRSSQGSIRTLDTAACMRTHPSARARALTIQCVEQSVGTARPPLINGQRRLRRFNGQNCSLAAIFCSLRKSSSLAHRVTR